MKDKNDNSHEKINQPYKDSNTILINDENQEFYNLMKYMENIININLNNISKESELKIISKLDEINKDIDICLLLDNDKNTLIQYYIAKDLDNLGLIIILINFYKSSLINNDPDKFYNWLINLYNIKFLFFN